MPRGRAERESGSWLRAWRSGVSPPWKATAARWGPPCPLLSPFTPPSLQLLLAGAQHFTSWCASAEIRALPVPALGSPWQWQVGTDLQSDSSPPKFMSEKLGAHGMAPAHAGNQLVSPLSWGETLTSPSPIHLPQGCCGAAPACSSLMPVPWWLPQYKPAQPSSELPSL